MADAEELVEGLVRVGLDSPVGRARADMKGLDVKETREIGRASVADRFAIQEEGRRE
jgi:hypothetical protein